MASAGVRSRRRWPRLLLTALLALPGPARAADAPVAATPLAVPDVPYVPQSEALCGGAALAMVLRYWGTRDVSAEDFAAFLTADGRGITTEALAAAAVARGVLAHALALTRESAAVHLEKGRPLIALIATSGGGHHYVVVLAWTNGRVLFHDPAVAPFRVMEEAEWLRAWNAAGSWALLVLPGDGTSREPATAGAPPSASGGDECAALVSPAVERARAGEREAAQVQLEAAAVFCPRSSAPLRELASLAFRRDDFRTAQALAARAVAVDPGDAFAWRLLATSRFLDGRREEALDAWNHVGEPRLDVAKIEGLDRTPFRRVSGALDASPDGVVLTPARLRRAQRRVAALPAVQTSRVAYRPLPGGRARLEVAIVERPAFPLLIPILLQSAARAASDRTIGADVQAVARSGDTLRAAGFWHPRRARGTLAASGLHALGLPGIVTAEALWDEQSYRRTPAGPIARERRRRGALSVSDWWSADTRVRLGVAADEFGTSTRASFAADVDRRALRDRLALGAAGAGWWFGTPFYRGSVRVAARTRVEADRPLLNARMEYAAASADAPLALWPGAGTGPGRGVLLRAHPLLHEGIVDGDAFGRWLLSANVEGETPFMRIGPTRLRAALFLDGATRPDPRRTFVDVGAGLRVRLPGAPSSFRFDVAVATEDGHVRVSAGYQADWPN